MNRHLVPFRSSGLAPFFGKMEPVDLSRFFDDFLNPLFEVKSKEKNGMSAVNFRPLLNVTEDEEAIVVSAEIPGVSEEDLDLSLDEGALVLRGEKKVDYDETKGKVHFVGCSYGSFEQRIPLPCEIDEEAIEATTKNGKLNIRLPKRAENKERIKKISVKSE